MDRPDIIPEWNDLSRARRHLPATATLQAFEAAARLGSFTMAARDLALTQSAVSRQIRALEDSVGQALFFREKQTVRLTPVGHAYAAEIRRALAIISAATIGCRVNPGGGVLNLAVLPTFGTRWLAPRLARFNDQHPGITLSLTTRLAPFDFDLDSVDLAIHFGRPHWPGGELLALMPEAVLPVCSPGLRDRLGFVAPADLLRAPLIKLASRADAWPRWFAHHGIDQAPGAAMLIDQFATAAQLAMAGAGVALMPTFLIVDELAQGQLVTAIATEPSHSEEGYHLVWPVGRRDYPPLVAFRAWICAEAANQTTPVAPAAIAPRH
jgi:DNA-binding transcriptional LysR family regulator